MNKAPGWAIIGIFLILLVQTLLWSSDFLIPITAAILGYLTVSPVRRRLYRWGIPSSVTAFFITFGVLVLVLYGALRFAEPLADMTDNLPRLVQQFSESLSDGGGETVKKINEAVDAAEKVLDGDEEEPALEVKVVEEANFISTLVKSAPQIVGQAVFALILLFFLISSGDLYMLKIVQASSSFDDKRRAVKIVQTLERKLGHYLGSITLINLGLGISIGLAMWFLGLSTPILFGLLAFGLNFIPFLGAVAGATIAGLVAFNEFNQIWEAAVVFAVYMTLTSIEGQFVTPKLLSNRLKLNTPIVFIAVAFFAWIWSVIGMIVAVPILIVVKIVFDEFESTRKIGAFLGDA